MVEGNGERDAFGQSHEWIFTATRAAIEEAPPGKEATDRDHIAGALASHPSYADIQEKCTGGFGIIYIAYNRMMGRKEILKVMRPKYAARPETVDQFLGEIRIAGSIAHKNIIRGYGASWIQDVLVFSMEYVDGLDLRSAVTEGGPLPVGRAADVAYQVLRALHHLHALGITHRDITPGNLMIAGLGMQETVKLIDFGLATSAHDAGGDASPFRGKFLGTPSFTAPEQARDAAVADLRSDIYSLGCTLYYMLSGKPPFHGETIEATVEAADRHEYEPLRSQRADIPAKFAAVVDKMMARDPGERFQSPRYAATALSPYTRLNILYKNMFDIEFPIILPHTELGKLGKFRRLKKEPPEKNPLFDALLASIPEDASYEMLARSLPDLNHEFRERIAARLGPALNARIRMPDMPHDTYEEKKKLARWVNDQLEPLGLAVKCPKTGLPAKLRAQAGNWPGIGRFAIEVMIDGKQKTPSVSDKLPELTLTDASLPREPEVNWQQAVGPRENRAARRR